MGPASVVSIALGVVALCAALLNFGLHRLGRRSRDHFWLAVAALGVAQLAVGNALVYEAQTLAAALHAQFVSLSSGVMLIAGFLRFASLSTGARILWLEVPANLLTVGVVASILLWPDIMFTGGVIEVHLPALGLHFLQTELTPLAGILSVPFLFIFFAVSVLFWLNRRAMEQPILMVGFALLWLAAIANDTLVAIGIYDGPHLVVAVYVVFLLAFSFFLVRRFAERLDTLEADSDQLRRLVEERTEALRQKDMQVAHGARMATVGTLAAGLAQEIRDPLGEVMERLDRAADHFGAAEERDAFDSALADSQAGVDRIRSIVTKLLHVARRDTGRFGPVDLNQVVESVLPIVGHEARARAVLETSLQRLPSVEGDERLLGQVVLNLVLNALHATPQEGASMHRVRVCTTATPDGVRLTVSDTGAGIPDEIREHVFDPFFTTKAPGEGSGLGLTVTRQIVERHHGQIEVESSHEGTIFIVELPAASSPLERP